MTENDNRMFTIIKEVKSKLLKKNGIFKMFLKACWKTTAKNEDKHALSA